jgi:hypothetical protein
MSNPLKPKEKTAPLSVRFSETEKSRLMALAGNKPLGLFIRERVLDGQAEARRVRTGPVRDSDALGRLLGLLGQSRLANNLNQLAKAANLGALPVTAELETELQQACAEVFEMRRLLLNALGIQIMGQALAEFSEATQGSPE